MKRLALAVLVLLLAGCAPVADWTADQLNEAAGDDAALYLVSGEPPAACADATTTGLCFDPTGEAAGAILALRGEALAVEPASLCEGSTDRLTCHLGDVEEPVFVAATGQSVAASVTYRRPGESRVHQEIATNP